MATSMGDATSLASMDSVENLTELDEIKKALERLSKQEVSALIKLFAQKRVILASEATCPQSHYTVSYNSVCINPTKYYYYYRVPVP